MALALLLGWTVVVLGTFGLAEALLRSRGLL